MISHFQQLTPTASFVFSDLFINDTIESYEVPINLRISNQYDQSIIVILIGKEEDSSTSTGIILSPNDLLELSGVGSHYQIGIKYLSVGTSGTVMVSSYQFTKVTK